MKPYQMTGIMRRYSLCGSPASAADSAGIGHQAYPSSSVLVRMHVSILMTMHPTITLRVPARIFASQYSHGQFS